MCSKVRVDQPYANRQLIPIRDAAESAVTTPTVTELRRRCEPVTADTFLGDLAVEEQRLYGDAQTALIALGLHQPPPSCQPETFGSTEV